MGFGNGFRNRFEMEPQRWEMPRYPASNTDGSEEAIEHWLENVNVGNWLIGDKIHDMMPVKGDLNESIKTYERDGRYRDAAELYLVGGLSEMSLKYLRKAGMYLEAAAVAESVGLDQTAEIFRYVARTGDKSAFPWEKLEKYEISCRGDVDP